MRWRGELTCGRAETSYVDRCQQLVGSDSNYLLTGGSSMITPNEPKGLFTAPIKFIDSGNHTYTLGARDHRCTMSDALNAK